MGIPRLPSRGGATSTEPDDVLDKAPSVQVHPPTRPDPEPREETIARVVHEAEEVHGTEAHVELEDPSTRRGLNRALARTMLMLAAGGFAVGAVIGLILSFVSGPFELVGRGNIEGSTDWLQTLLYALTLGGAVALVTAVIGSLIFLAREDGRVERKVEEETGIHPPAPADPIDPEHDPKPR